MKLLPAILASGYRGANGNVQTSVDPRTGDTILQGHQWFRPHRRLRVHPRTCTLHKKADKLYVAMNPWWKPHWQLSQQVHTKKVYDTWMSQCMYAFNRLAYAPIVPSASGGHSPADVTPSGLFPPTMPPPPPIGQAAYGQIIQATRTTPGPVIFVDTTLKLLDHGGAPAATYPIWYRSAWCPTHSTYHYNRGGITRNNLLTTIRLGLWTCYPAWTGTAWWCLRTGRLDVVFPVAGLLNTFVGQQWPAPEWPTRAFNTRANPAGSLLPQIARPLATWTPTITAVAGPPPPPGAPIKWRVTVTTPADQRLDRSDRTLCMAATGGTHSDPAPPTPTVTVRITAQVQSFDMLAAPYTVFYAFTANLGGAPAWGIGGLLESTTLSAASLLAYP